MIAYRTFRNGDPPALARIWNSQPPHEQRLSAMTAMIVDELVLAKPYFDRRGLILATADDRPVGFAHAGFGPTADGSQLDRTVGATLVLVVERRPDSAAIAARLLSESENYLRAAGAHTLVGGMPAALEPFYWGLSGGCGAVGVSSSAREFVQTLTAAGYSPTIHTRLFRRPLPGFRPVFDRQHLQWRRAARVTVQTDESKANWWEACTFASSERTRAELHLPDGANRVRLRFWDLRPLTDSWGERGQGLLEFACDDLGWTDGLARFVWSETLELLQQQGVTSVMAGAADHEVRLAALLPMLGFHEFDQMAMFVKPLGVIA